MKRKGLFQITAGDIDGLTKKYLNDEAFHLRWNPAFQCWTYGELSAYDAWEFLQYIEYMLEHPEQLRKIQHEYQEHYPKEMRDLLHSIAHHGKIQVPDYIECDSQH